MPEKQKKIIQPNECSLLRWILVLIVGYLLGILFSLIIEIIRTILSIVFSQIFQSGIIQPLEELIQLMVIFAGFFIGTVLALSWIAKTPLKTFVLGTGGKFNKKETGIILGLYIFGVLISCLLTVGNMEFNVFSPVTYIVNIFFCLIFVFMQTTFEEIVFRGFFIRYACKNNIKMSAKTIMAGLLSSVIFMLMHGENPEVLSQSNFQVFLALLSYMIAGLGLFFADIYFKSLMPGIVIHWINNLFAFIVVSTGGSTGNPPSIFIDKTVMTGTLYLVQVVLCYLPLLAYIFYDSYKKQTENI